MMLKRSRATGITNMGQIKGTMSPYKGCLDSMERGTVEWNSGTVELWNGGMVE